MTTPTDQVERARRIVMRHGWNSTAYQILNPHLTVWLARDRDAAAGVVRAGRWWVTAGAPVCDVARLPAVMAELESDAAADRCRVAYVCVASRVRRVARRSGRHAVIAIGAEPVWTPAGWIDMVASRSSVRAQVNRARNKGVVVEPVEPPTRASAMPELREVLADWLRHRPLPPLHFLVEPETIDGVLADRRVWVARRGGRAEAFLLASPVPGRDGYLVEQIARRHDAPNGTAELLIHEATAAMANEGCRYMTLGLVALTTHAATRMRHNPAWLRGLTGFARLHGRRFYHFDGLEAFRHKLRPQRWEPIYVAANAPRVGLDALYAIASAFCKASPWRVLAGGLARAVHVEASNFADWATSRL